MKCCSLLKEVSIKTACHQLGLSFLGFTFRRIDKEFFSHWLPNNINGSKDILIRDCPRPREDEEDESNIDEDLFADLEDEVCVCL